MNNFWGSIEKPIVGLAPMDGITDAAMRFITKKYGGMHGEALGGEPSSVHTSFATTDNLSLPASDNYLDSRFADSGYGDRAQRSCEALSQKDMDSAGERDEGTSPPNRRVNFSALGNLSETDTDSSLSDCNQIAYPNVIFNEFVSTDGLKAGAVKIMKDLRTSEIERPVVAQLYGTNPLAFYESTLIICALGFDGVDINMGCPAKSVEQRGGGAGLINNRELAEVIVGECKRAIRDWGNGIDLAEAGVHGRIVEYLKDKSQFLISKSQRGEIPLSLKTRIGFKERDMEWMKKVAGFEVAAATIHGRVYAQRHSGEVDWEGIAEAAKIIKPVGSIVLGNGGIGSLAEAKNKTKKYGLDGVLIGQAAVGNPWVFSEDEYRIMNYELRMKVAMEHAKKFEEMYPGESFLPVRKHLAWYVRGFDGAVELRKKLVLANSSEEVERVMCEYRIMNNEL